MTKDQFLRELRIELSGRLPEGELKKQLDFYEEYIRTRSVARTEEEITAQLGSPRLIAKSILASHSAAGTQADETVFEDGSSAKEKKNGRRIINMPAWLFITIVVIVVLLVGVLLIGAIGYLLPILLPLALLYFVLRLIIKNRRE